MWRRPSKGSSKAKIPVAQPKDSGGIKLLKEAMKRIIKGPKKPAAKKVAVRTSDSSSNENLEQPGPSTSRKYRKAVRKDTSSDSSSDDIYEPPTTSKARKIKPVSKSSAKSKVWFLTIHLKKSAKFDKVKYKP